MRRSTIVVLLLFLVMAGAYYFLNNREEPADIAVTPEPEAEISYLFTAEDGLPVSIRIESKAGETVEVARDAENVWALTLPVEASADQAAVESAASQIPTMRILDRLPGIDPKAVGVDVPEYTLTIKFTSGVERFIEVGVITPTEGGYYVRSEDGEVVIISRNTMDLILGLLQTPPYAETPTPFAPVQDTPEAGTPSSETATPQP